MGYCVKGEKQEEDCSLARRKIRKEHGGKLPKDLEKTPSQSCLFCASWME